MKTIQMTHKQFSVVFIVFCLSLLGYGQGVELVKDINPGPDYSNPQVFYEINGILYFTALHIDYGFELWASDGTETGTHMLKDINPGFSFSNAAWLTPYDGMIYFAADDGVHGKELWVTDGTESGTVMLKDINVQGGIDADASPVLYFTLNGLLFFTADDGIHGRELWVTDGTVEGTELFLDIKPGTGSSNPLYFTEYNGQFYFTADDNTHGRELWVTDGTVAGTSLVTDIRTGGIGSTPYIFGVFNNKLYMTADEGVSGREIWLSDGTMSGTAILKDIYSGSGSSDPGGFWVLNGKLLFNADDNVHGRELWSTDGSESGTVLVKDINPGSESSFGSYGRYGELNGMLFFAVNDEAGDILMWKTDGTLAGTELFMNVSPSGGQISSYYFTNYAGKLYFYSDGNIWETDGTQVGTVRLPDLTPYLGSNQFTMKVYNNHLFYRALYDSAVGVELYKYQDPALSLNSFDFYSISIYPNPTNDFLMINAKSLIEKIQIYDTGGRLVMEDFPDLLPYQMSTKYLKTGVYFVQISSKGKISTHKIIKN